MTLFSPNSRERISVRLFDWRGRARKQAVRRMRHFLRCLRTKRSHHISFRLLARVYRVYKAFGKRTLYVYSGFRHRSVARLKRSYHTRGQAMDFRIPGVSRRRLRDYLLRTFKNAGVGYYPNSPFVHFDVRKKRMFWVDASGPGEAARYVNPRSVLRAERRSKRSKKARRRLARLTRRAVARVASKAKRTSTSKTTTTAKTNTKTRTRSPDRAVAAAAAREVAKVTREVRVNPALTAPPKGASEPGKAATTPPVAPLPAAPPVVSKPSTKPVAKPASKPTAAPDVGADGGDHHEPGTVSGPAPVGPRPSIARPHAAY